MTADPHAPTHAADEIPTSGPAILGARYEIAALLGAGGMGNVYRARDLELDEWVALKVLRPEIAGAPGAIERFRREVKLARRVTHPNVARVFDIGEQGGDKILTMELVEGEALSALLERERKLPVARAIEIASAVCAGVGAAHAAGVVHRDLKPDNVLLARDGRVVVTDFGIARAAVQESNKTFGGFVGTPAYMAPEQVDGTNVDHRADVFAFGVMLFEMLAGTLPWTGETPIALAAARLLHPPPDPRTACPDIGERLSEIVLRCLARQPGDRFATMLHVANALGTITASAATRPAAISAVGLNVSESSKRVVVLPFRNLGSSEFDDVAEGLTDDLVDVLSVARGLRVHARGAAARFTTGDRDAREIGRELGAQVVVDGCVRRTPGAFRINARLISVADGLQLWAKRFDGTEAEMLALNDEVARSVAEALTADLAPAVARALDGRAAELYLRARHAHHQSYFGGTGAAALFAQALECAPDDPRIIAGYVMASLREVPRGDQRVTLKALAESAVRIGAKLPETHAALAAVLLHAGDEVGAVHAARHALRISPDNIEAHEILGRVLEEADSPEGVRHLERVLEIEPVVPAHAFLARHAALAGDWARAEAIIEGLSTVSAPQAILSQTRLFAIWRQDRVAATAAIANLNLPGLRPVIRMQNILRLICGEKIPLAECVPIATAAPLRHRAFTAQMLTEAACVAGQVEVALDALESDDALPIFDIAWLGRCPLLEAIHREPRYPAIQARVAARAAAVREAYASPEA